MTAGISFEKDVFTKKRVNINQLLEYGFVKESDTYHYSKLFLDNLFRADIMVHSDGSVEGHVFDMDMEEEYLPLRVAMNTSAYVSSVREAYQEILEDIATHCFSSVLFESDQANRMAAYITDRHGDIPDHPFKKQEGTSFRNPQNNKWYALVMPVAEKKIRKTKNEGEIEIVNIKCKPETINELLKMPGVYPAYHMTKKSWVSITLDDSLEDDALFHLINVSRALTLEAHSPAGELSATDWLIPCNPKYYDIVKAFKKEKEIVWKQSTKVHVGDTCYMYVAAPYSSILFRCQVLETNIPYKYNGVVHVTQVMKIRLLQKYDAHLLDLKVLKHYGVTSMRSPRKVPLQLKKVLERLNQMD